MKVDPQILPVSLAGQENDPWRQIPEGEAGIAPPARWRKGSNCIETDSRGWIQNTGFARLAVPNLHREKEAEKGQRLGKWIFLDGMVLSTKGQEGTFEITSG